MAVHTKIDLLNVTAFWFATHLPFEIVNQR